MVCWRFCNSLRLRLNSGAGSSLGIVVAIIGSIWTFLAVWLIAIAEEEKLANTKALHLQAKKNAVFAADICVAEVCEVVKNDKITTLNSDFCNSSDSSNNDWLGCFDNSSGDFLGWFVSGQFDKTQLNINSLADIKIEENLDCKNVESCSFSYKATDLGVRPIDCKIEPNFCHSNTVDGGQKIDFLKNIDIAKDDFPAIKKFLKQISKKKLKPNATTGIYPVIIQVVTSIRLALNSSNGIIPYLSVAFVLWNPYSKPIAKNNYCLEINLAEESGSLQKTPELEIFKTDDNCAQFLCGNNGILAKIAINEAFQSGEIKCITFNSAQHSIAEINNGIHYEGIKELKWPVNFKRTMDLSCNIGDNLNIALPATHISFVIKDLITESIYQKLSFNAPAIASIIKLCQNDSFGFFYTTNFSQKTEPIELVQLRSSNINVESKKNENYDTAIDAFGLSDFFPKPDSIQNNQGLQQPWELTIINNIPKFNFEKKQFANYSKIKPKPLYCLCDNNKNFLTKLNAFPAKLDNQSMPAFWLGEGRKVSQCASDSISGLNRIFWNKYFYQCNPNENPINIHSTNINNWSKILYEFFEKNEYYCQQNTLNDIAKKLISEIKKRGPFKSIADFFVDNSKKIPGCFQKVLNKYTNLPKRLSQAKFAETVGNYLHSKSDSFLICSTSSLTKNHQTLSKQSKILLQRKVIDKNNKPSVFISKIFLK